MVNKKTNKVIKKQESKTSFNSDLISIKNGMISQRTQKKPE